MVRRYQHWRCHLFVWLQYPNYFAGRVNLMAQTTTAHVALGCATTSNGGVCAWARGTKKRGLRVVCALSSAPPSSPVYQRNQGNQATTEITEINRNRRKSTEIKRRFCVSCVSCVAPRGSGRADDHKNVQFTIIKKRTLHCAPAGQEPSGPDWLATALGFGSRRALATSTAWAGLCLIHHHHHHYQEAQRTAPTTSPP